MTLVTWVQFFRNLICVLKTVLPPELSLFASILPGAQFPFSKISILDFFLGATQLGGAYFCFKGSSSSISKSLRDWRRTCNLLASLDKLLLRHAKHSSGDKKPFTIEPVILRQGLVRSKNAAEGIVATNFGVIAVGVVFTVCSLSSWRILEYLSLHPQVRFHYPEITIHALVVLELSLFYLLYPMFNGFREKINGALRGFRFAEQVAFEEDNKATLAARMNKKDASGEKVKLSMEEIRSKVKLNTMELLLAASEVGYNDESMMMDSLTLSLQQPLQLSSMNNFNTSSNKAERKLMEQMLEKDLSYLQTVFGLMEQQKIGGDSSAPTAEQTSAETEEDDHDQKSTWRDVDDDQLTSPAQLEAASVNSCSSTDINARSMRYFCSAMFDLLYFVLNVVAVLVIIMRCVIASIHIDLPSNLIVPLSIVVSVLYCCVPSELPIRTSSPTTTCPTTSRPLWRHRPWSSSA